MKPLIIGNWKCNPLTLAEAKKLFDSVEEGLANIKNTETVICPPFVFLPAVNSGSSCIKLGAQDCFWEKSGAFTSGISPFMLKNLSCDYVILGHSERRIHFGDTNEIINKKIKTAISAGLKPIFCIGETEKEKKEGETESVLTTQIEKGLIGISVDQIKDIVIAYEPVWAIGTGNPCEPEETKKMVALIQKIISELYSDKISGNLRILYGGSLNSKNVGDYFKSARVYGFIIGGASLNPEEFIKIIKIIS
jgi:triosephosphate isomerase